MIKYFYKCLPKISYQQGDYELEPVQPEHIEKIRQWRNEQMDVLRQSKPISKEQQIQYYEEHIWSELKSNQPKNILLSYKHRNKLIGYGGLVHISWEHLRAEISFLSDTSIVEKNKLYRIYFQNFLYMLRELSFEILGLKRLFTETFAFRMEQIKILEDSGMDIDGILKSNYLINDKFFDSVIQSVINK